MEMNWKMVTLKSFLLLSTVIVMVIGQDDIKLDQLLVVGGKNAFGPTNDVEIVNLGATGTQTCDKPDDFPLSCEKLVGVIFGGKVLVTGLKCNDNNEYMSIGCDNNCNKLIPSFILNDDLQWDLGPVLDETKCGRRHLHMTRIGYFIFSCFQIFQLSSPRGEWRKSDIELNVTMDRHYFSDMCTFNVDSDTILAIYPFSAPNNGMFYTSFIDLDTLDLREGADLTLNMKIMQCDGVKISDTLIKLYIIGLSLVTLESQITVLNLEINMNNLAESTMMLDDVISSGVPNSDTIISNEDVGLLFVGGFNMATNQASSSLFSVDTATDRFTQKNERLTMARYQAALLLLPNNCNWEEEVLLQTAQEYCPIQFEKDETNGGCKCFKRIGFTFKDDSIKNIGAINIQTSMQNCKKSCEKDENCQYFIYDINTFYCSPIPDLPLQDMVQRTGTIMAGLCVNDNVENEIAAQKDIFPDDARLTKSCLSHYY